MPTVLCQRYWNESFLIIVQRASLTAQMLESAREQTDRQPHPLFCKPIMTHNLHVTRSDPLLLNSSTPFCSDLNNSTGKKKKKACSQLRFSLCLVFLVEQENNSKRCHSWGSNVRADEETYAATVWVIREKTHQQATVWSHRTLTRESGVLGLLLVSPFDTPVSFLRRVSCVHYCFSFQPHIIRTFDHLSVQDSFNWIAFQISLVNIFSSLTVAKVRFLLKNVEFWRQH